MRLRFCFAGLGRFLTGSVLLVVFASGVQAQVEIWTTRYTSMDYQDDATAMVLTPDGNLAVTGFSVGPDWSRDIATLKIDAVTGETLWVRRWSRGSGSRDIGWAIATDTAGNIFVAGKTSTGIDTDFVTIKYLADGTEAWARRYNVDTCDAAVAVRADGSGGAYVTGHVGSLRDRSDYLTIRYASDGTEVWVAQYNGPGNGNDLATALALDDSGNVYVTGFSWGGAASCYDYLTIRYSPLGETVWTRRYDGSSSGNSLTENDYAHAITVDDSGNVFVTGRAGESGTWYDATTVKYSSAGEQVWVNRLDWGENGLDGAGEIALGPDRSVYCAGFTETDIGSYDYLVYKLDPSGTMAWKRSYNYVSDDDSINALFVDRFGNAYVTGYSYSIEGDLDWVTIKYNSNGDEVWIARHATFDEDDDAWDVVANSFGDVFVAGYDYYEGSEQYAVVKYSEPDVGVSWVVEPQDTFRLDATVTPAVWVRNYGAMTLTFPVRLEIGNFYFDVQNVAALAPYDSVEVRFTPWRVRDVGVHQVTAYSMLPGDKEPSNDTAYGTVTTVAVWEQLSDLPPGAKNRAVKDGGALAFIPDSLLFGFKGNNTVEFYCFNLNTGAWSERESIPPIGRSGQKKRVKKGAQLAPDTLGNIYAFKGNNTLEFWRYQVASNSWSQLEDYPASGTNRKIKGGAGLVFVPGQNRVYGNRGGNTNDFYAYDVTSSSWIRMKDIPLGERSKKAKDGTALAYDGDSTIYLLKGGTYEFWAYRVGTDSWGRKKDIRDSQYNPRRRKVKNGAALAYDPAYHRVYAFKGGKQTEFWFFDVAADSWVETRDTVPRGPSDRGPYGGADLVFGNGKLYAFKGNKTREFWRYHANLPLNPPLPGDGQGAVTALLPQIRLTVAPNPFAASTVISYNLPQSGKVRLSLFDVAGRRRRVLVNRDQPSGRQVVPLAASGLASGVYLVRLDVDGPAGKTSTTQKVLLTR